MTEPEPLFSIADLVKRYNVSRTVIYERLNGLGITRIKSEKRSYVTQADLDLLDELHQFIGQGGTITDFSQSRNLSIQPSTDIGLQSSIVGEALIYKVFELLAGDNRQRLTDPTWQHERLERCAEQGWLLSSTEVKQLIGVKPSGEIFRRGTWEFVREGKIGRSVAWKVQKAKGAE